MAIHEPLEGLLKDGQLGAGALGLEGVGPDLFDVADDGQRPPLGVRQQPLWQAGHKGIRGRLLWFRPGAMRGKVVDAGRAGGVGPPEKGQQSEQSGIAGDVGGGKVKVLGNRSLAPPGLASGPILAEEGSLVG